MYASIIVHINAGCTFLPTSKRQGQYEVPFALLQILHVHAQPSSTVYGHLHVKRTLLHVSPDYPWKSKSLRPISHSEIGGHLNGRAQHEQ
jgi:hypothetical protein